MCVECTKGTGPVERGVVVTCCGRRQGFLKGFFVTLGCVLKGSGVVVRIGLFVGMKDSAVVNKWTGVSGGLVNGLGVVIDSKGEAVVGLSGNGFIVSTSETEVGGTAVVERTGLGLLDGLRLRFGGGGGPVIFPGLLLGFFK